MSIVSNGTTADQLQSLPLDVVGFRKSYPDGALSEHEEAGGTCAQDSEFQSEA